jgi:hypothetical protein
MVSINMFMALQLFPTSSFTAFQPSSFQASQLYGFPAYCPIQLRLLDYISSEGITNLNYLYFYNTNNCDEF